MRAPITSRSLLTPSIALLGVVATSGIALAGQFTVDLWNLPVLVASVAGSIGWLCAGVIAWQVFRRVQQGATLPLRHLLLGTALFAAPFFLALPVFAGDVFAYIASVKVAALGNPYHLTLSTLGTDPILHEVYPLWQTLPLTYGPLWAVLLKGLSVVTRDVLPLLGSFRLLGLLGVLGCGWILHRTVGATRALLFVWNPIVLIEAVGDAHHDVLVGLAVLGAVVLARRPLRSAWALAAGAALKYVPVILIPLLAFSHAPWRRRFLQYLGIVLVSFTIITLPFWVGPQTFRGVVEQQQLFAVPVFFPQFILYGASYLAFGTTVHPELMARLAGTFLFAAIAIFAIVRQRQLTLAGAAALTLAAYIAFGSANVQTWYFLWFLPLLPLLPGRHAVRWTGVAIVVWVAMIFLPFRLWIG